MKCIICNEEHCRDDVKSFPITFCSWKCYEEWTKFNKTPNCSCEVCKVPMYLKPYRLKRVKHGITCSKKCFAKRQEKLMSGTGNHQHGLIGDKNKSWNGGIRISTYGYRMILDRNHPRSSKSNKYIFEHILVVEQNYKSFDLNCFYKKDDKFYLKKKFEVHHIDENKLNNSLNNLSILSKSEHIKLHKRKRHAVLKSSEFRETPEVDNPEPSTDLNGQ